jgi:hypothetical protein
MSECVFFSIYGGLKKTDVQQARYFMCDNTNQCNHYKNGKCVCQPLIFSTIKCPHAKYGTSRGYSERASKYYTWKAEIKGRLSPKVKTANEKLCICGDYVYLPYPHLDVWGTKVVEELQGEHFIPISYFTADVIHQVATHRPHALMGGEITDYQAKHVPKFIQHLKEEMPDKYEEYAALYPGDIKKYLQSCQTFVD